MLEIRDSLIAHPGIVELRYRHPLLSPGALMLTELGIRTLRDAGFSNREAGRIYRILFIYTFGFCAFGPGPRSAHDRDESVAALRALPADRYPALAESAWKRRSRWLTRRCTRPAWTRCWTVSSAPKASHHPPRRSRPGTCRLRRHVGL